jgi:ABC-type phosphate transport system substrate-binding protein
VEIESDGTRRSGLVTGDVDELIQVFSNLIENACKYGQTGKRVEITVVGRRAGHRAGAQVSVRDFGPGIRDQVQIAGSSTVLPYATIVAEAFGENFDFPTPVVESGGSSTAGPKLLRRRRREHHRHRELLARIRDSEIETCAANGVTDIIEVRIGYDGIVFASDINGPSFAFTPSDWYLALARRCPSTARWSTTRTPCGRT